MGNPLSNTMTTTSKPLTAGGLANVPDGPGMMGRSLEKQNHEMVALGIPVVRRDMNSTHDASGSDDIQLYDGEVPTILKNWRGWVNPEDLPPMPQCIAQQNDDDWLSAMTTCTKLRCTNRFIFCTHHQWLTELSCLRDEFHPYFMERYNDHCSRSVLAKAQLMHWIQEVTGRSWIVVIGDTNGLQNLSPKTLPRGYKSVDVAEKAPYCMRKPNSLVEKFDFTMLTCGFTSTTISQGNAARPWEYNPRLKSMTALSWDTAGYDLTHGYIPDGQYFDVDCFCHRFSDEQQQPDPCSDKLEFTKERLWIHAICGPSALPRNWNKWLMVPGFDYISMEEWERSSDIPNMPENVTASSQECTTEVCDTDSEGFCQLVPAIDRTCMCSKVNYDVCQGACQDFESRKQYLNWSYNLCFDERDWHGLPEDWLQLLEPQPRDMIPWRWTLTPDNADTTTCPSYVMIMGSFTLVNLATILAVFFGERCTRSSTTLAPPPTSPVWILRALVLASVQLVGYWLMVEIIQSTPGYGHVPTVQLLLLFCSLPRLSWLVIAPTGLHRPESKDLTAASSALYAEALLQIPNFYHMAMTVNYGRRHGFYFGVLPSTDAGHSARLMYGGALMWLVVVALMAVPTIRIVRTMFAFNIAADEPGGYLSSHGVGNYARYFRDARVGDPLLRDQHWNASPNEYHYGTVPVRAGSSYPEEDPRAPHLNLYVVLTLGFPLIFLAQCLFWIGFLRVSGVDFCPPSIGMLTGVGTVSSLMVVALKFVL